MTFVVGMGVGLSGAGVGPKRLGRGRACLADYSEGWTPRSSAYLASASAAFRRVRLGSSAIGSSAVREINALAVTISDVPSVFVRERDPKDEPDLNLAITSGA